MRKFILLLLCLPLVAQGAVDGRGFFGGAWVGVSREATTQEIDVAWDRILAPVYKDVYDDKYSVPGVYWNAFMPSSVVKGPGSFDFSILDRALRSKPVADHNGNIGIDIRLEGRVFPTHWDPYTFIPPGQRKPILNLSNPKAVDILKDFLDNLAKKVNKHPQFKAICIGEMSGSSGVTEVKKEVIEYLAQRLEHAYACVVQNSDGWAVTKEYSGVARLVAGPKLAEGGCGSGNKNWPTFDCSKNSRYGSFQWGNILGDKPPSSYPRVINIASIEPNEFTIVGRGDGLRVPNPWNKSLPDPSLSLPGSNVDHNVFFWALSGKPRFPERAASLGIEPRGGIMPAAVIVVYAGFGKKDDPTRINNIQSAFRTFGFRGTGQLFPAWEGEAPAPEKKQCNDGIDNDGDDKIDLADPGCSSSNDDDESDDPIPPQCSDGLDNDGDDKIDLADPGCSSAQDNDERDDVIECPDLVLVHNKLEQLRIDLDRAGEELVRMRAEVNQLIKYLSEF